MKHIFVKAIGILSISVSLSLSEQNSRPIIGILTQRMPSSMEDMLPPGHNFTTYVAASYIKWVEAAGARAVPIVVNSEPGNLEQYTEMFAGISGLLIPGGAVSIHSSPYAEASNFFFDLAKMDNDAGDIFPIWGTCLGFEMLALMANDNVPNLKNCNSYDQALALDLLEGWNDSKLLGQADSKVIEDLSTLPVTINFHHWCLTMENFTLFQMERFWRPLSTNIDEDGLEFISTMEAKNYPFFATQFHPEKNSFEWAPKYPGIPHTKEAVEVAQYFSEFFIDLARQSSHKFDSREDEEKFLIYNYQPFYTGKAGRDSGFQQAYFF